MRSQRPGELWSDRVTWCVSLHYSMYVRKRFQLRKTWTDGVNGFHSSGDFFLDFINNELTDTRLTEYMIICSCTTAYNKDVDVLEQNMIFWH